MHWMPIFKQFSKKKAVYEMLRRLLFLLLLFISYFLFIRTDKAGSFRESRPKHRFP